VALAERAESELRGAVQASWFERLEREHDNLRAALGWCLENEVVAGLRAAASLWRFWWLRGHHHEGRRWLDLLLAAPIPALSGEAATAAVVARARALHGAGFVAFHSGDRRAKPLLEESQALLSQVGRRNGTGDTLRLLGRLAFEEGSLSQARALEEESLAILRETGAPPGSRHGTAGTLHQLAMLEWTASNLARARELAEESLRIFREVRDPHGAGWALVFLGQLARTSGDFPTAVQCLKGSLTAFQMVGHRIGIGWALGRLGALALKTGDLDQASTLLEQSLSMFREGAYQPNLSRTYSEEAGVSWTLGYLGYLALSKGDTAQARSLLQESLSLLREFPAAPRATTGAASSSRSSSSLVRAISAGWRGCRARFRRFTRPC
jgi:tetratricopeptide (TPR) repeat protein